MDLMHEVVKQQLDIEFRNLSYLVSTDRKRGVKTILHGINGQFRCGSLTAILGPSGAGKSSLLNIISGFRTSGVDGSVKVNGKERNLEEFRKFSCYITQEFTMFPQLTTRETIMFAADFKLGFRIPKQRKKVLVNRILEITGLTKAETTYVAKLSGGEKKRLSIGVELLTNPPVMFFDEPTSGLDSSSSLQVITHLKSLAKGGRTVVCTIHQPSSRLFEMFDDVYLLADGKCLYNGPTNEMISVFEEAGFQCPEHYNRADFALDIASRTKEYDVKGLVEKYSSDAQFAPPDSHRECRSDAVPFRSRFWRWRSKYQYKTSPLIQFWILLKRTMLCTVRDIYITRIRLLTHVLVALMLGLMCYQVGNDAKKVYTNVAYVFFFLIFLFFINPAVTTLTFPIEAATVRREHLNCWYTLTSYYFSKLISDLPVQALCPTLFTIISYFLSGQPPEFHRFARLCAMCILLAVLGQVMGYVFGALFGAQIGIYLVASVQNPLITLSGFLVRLKDIPPFLKWMTTLSYYRFGFQAAMQALYGFNRPNLKCSDAYCRLKYPEGILEEFGLAKDTYDLDMLQLVVWILSLQIILYFVLIWKFRALK